MDESQNAAVLREDGGCRHKRTGMSESSHREQSSGEAECSQGNGESRRGCQGEGKASGCGSYQEPEGLANHREAGGSSSVYGNGPRLHVDEGFQVFAGGGKRERLKARYDLIPACGMSRVAQAMGRGAERYGEENWHGLTVSNCLNHAIRHIFMHIAGDKSEDHLGHAAANLLMACDLNIKEDVDGRSESGH